MPPAEPVTTYGDPFALANSAERIRERQAQRNRTAEEIKARIEELEGDLETAAAKLAADGNYDLTSESEQEDAARVVLINSRLSGATEALKEVDDEDYRVEQILARGGNPDNPIIVRAAPQETISDRVVAQLREDGFGWGNGLQPMSRAAAQKHIVPGLEGEELRQALRGQPLAAAFTTGSWDPFVPREPGYTESARRPLQFFEIIPVGTTMSDTVEYMLETTYSPAAATVAENAAASEAEYALKPKTAPVVRVGHVVPVTEQALNDEGQVRAYLEDVLPFGVLQALDNKCVDGSSATDIRSPARSPDVQILRLTETTGGFSTGLSSETDLTDGPLDASTGANSRMLKLVRTERRTLRDSARVVPTHIAMHPWLYEQAALSESASGGFYFGSPWRAEDTVLWGMRVVEADQMSILVNNVAAGVALAQNKFSLLMGSFMARYIQLYIREGLSTQMGMVEDQFAEWAYTLRSSIRAALAVKRPNAFRRWDNYKADGTAAATPS